MAVFDIYICCFLTDLGSVLIPKHIKKAPLVLFITIQLPWRYDED